MKRLPLIGAALLAASGLAAALSSLPFEDGGWSTRPQPKKPRTPSAKTLAKRAAMKRQGKARATTKRSRR